MRRTSLLRDRWSWVLLALVGGVVVLHSSRGAREVTAEIAGFVVSIMAGLFASAVAMLLFVAVFRPYERHEDRERGIAAARRQLEEPHNQVGQEPCPSCLARINSLLGQPAIAFVVIILCLLILWMPHEFARGITAAQRAIE